MFNIFKRILFIITVLMLFLCGCNDSKSASGIKQGIVAGKSSDNIVLPETQLSPVDLETDLHVIPYVDFRVREVLGSNYYGYKCTNTGGGIIEEYCLIDRETYGQTPLNYQAGIKDWIVGSDSEIVMQDRYLYEWKSYAQQISDEVMYDVKLLRVDGKNGSVKIIDKVKQSSPFIYMCKINDTQFISYSVSKATSDKTDYAVISSASIYNVEGGKQNIIHEIYENDESWSDSQGILIERFAVNNGEIYGYGRRLINNQYKHFLYHYDIDGQLLDEEPLDGFENIIGSEQPIEFSYLGNYISFRTYESLSNYICKKDKDGVKLIMKGSYGQVQYAIADKYILFMEDNVDVDTDEIKTGDYPIYIIDSTSDVIKAVKFQAPIDNPYFEGVISLSNGTILLSYCENSYDPLKVHQFLIDCKKIEQIMDNDNM